MLSRDVSNLEQDQTDTELFHSIIADERSWDTSVRVLCCLHRQKILATECTESTENPMIMMPCFSSVPSVAESLWFRAKAASEGKVSHQPSTIDDLFRQIQGEIEVLARGLEADAGVLSRQCE